MFFQALGLDEVHAKSSTKLKRLNNGSKLNLQGTLTEYSAFLNNRTPLGSQGGDGQDLSDSLE